MAEVMAGRSMIMNFPEYRFFSSAIVAGQLPIAVGVAAGIKRNGGKERVWCFCGDMAATTGAFHEASCYGKGHNLPIEFIIEDNGLSCETPTKEVWWHGAVCGAVRSENKRYLYYLYDRHWPHYGVKRNVSF